jgi:hypothetical protein
MKDAIGNDVYVGDTVIYIAPKHTSDRHLDISKVIKITKCGVTLNISYDGIALNRRSFQIVKTYRNQEE